MLELRNRVVAGAMFLALVSGTAALGQAPVKKTVAPAANAAHAGKHGRKGKALKAAAEVAPVQEIPPPPPPPNWPALSKAAKANVVWDGRELKIVAENSSLPQILRDVSTATGLKVEGLGGGNEQRVYGSYGPAAARDVLGELLEGTGYNVLMIGDQGQGAPRVLVLTAKNGKGGAKPAGDAAAQAQDGQDNGLVEDDTPDEPEMPEQNEAQPPPGLQRPNGMPPQGPGGRSPQEILQELQQRQLIQQQQLQNQQPQEIPQPEPPQ